MKDDKQTSPPEIMVSNLTAAAVLYDLYCSLCKAEGKDPVDLELYINIKLLDGLDAEKVWLSKKQKHLEMLEAEAVAEAERIDAKSIRLQNQARFITTCRGLKFNAGELVLVGRQIDSYQRN